MNGIDIRRARESAKVNQTDLAKALGLVDRATLTDIENGTIEVTTAYVLKAISVINGLAVSRVETV